MLSLVLVLPNNHTILWCAPHTVAFFDIISCKEVIEVWYLDVDTEFGWRVHVDTSHEFHQLWTTFHAPNASKVVEKFFS